MNDSTLDYMRNMIGIIQAFVEKGAVGIMDQMIYYGGLGASFDRDTGVHTADGKVYVIRPEFVNDFENEDYNNAYYEVEVIGEE